MPAAIRFPADFGAHPASGIEWWYVTGALESGPRLWGFQITFFRARTTVPREQPSRFAARQLLFAHAAVSDLEARRLRHDQRIARSGFGIAEASARDTAVVLDRWRLTRGDVAGRSRYAARAASDDAGFAFDVVLDATQPVLLQGRGGISRKGPQPASTSHYYSEPQLAVTGTLALDGRASAVRGRAWLDHEWSDSYLEADAVGWDWIGMNLDDGGALMAFRMRRKDGSTLWAGGSFRTRRRRDARLRCRRSELRPGTHVDEPGIGCTLSGRVAGRDAGRSLSRPRAARRRRSSTAAPAPARSTGKDCRCSPTPPATASAAATSR